MKIAPKFSFEPSVGLVKPCTTGIPAGASHGYVIYARGALKNFAPRVSHTPWVFWSKKIAYHKYPPAEKIFRVQYPREIV